MADKRLRAVVERVPERARRAFLSFWSLIGYLMLFLILLMVMSVAVYVVAR